MPNKKITGSKQVNKSMDIQKKLEQVQVSLSIEEFLRRFFGLWYEDATKLAMFLGFKTEAEYRQEESGEEASDWQKEETAYMQEQISSWNVLHKAYEDNDFSKVTLGEYNILKSFVDAPRKVEDDLTTKVVGILEKFFGGSQKGLEVLKAVNTKEMSILEHLYITPGDIDAHGDTWDLDDAKNLVKSFEEHGANFNYFHAYNSDDARIDKVWLNPVACTLSTPAGDVYIPENRPLCKVVFKNEKAFNARLEGKLKGLSIGARATDFEVIKSDDSLNSIKKAKRRIVKPHFNFPTAHIAYTSGSGAASLLNELIQVTNINKSLTLPITKEQEELLESLGHPLSEISKSLETSEKTPGSSSPNGDVTWEQPQETKTKGNTNTMSEDILKAYEARINQLENDLNVSKAKDLLNKYGLEAEVNTDLAKAVAAISADLQVGVFKALDAMSEKVKALEVKVAEAKPAELNEVQKAMAKEAGHSEKVPGEVNKTEAQLIIEAAKAQRSAK